MGNNLTWMHVEELSEALRCSVRFIRILVADRTFVPGKHFYKIGKHENGQQVFCLELCRQALLDETARLAKERKKN